MFRFGVLKIFYLWVGGGGKIDTMVRKCKYQLGTTTPCSPQRQSNSIHQEVIGMYLRVFYRSAAFNSAALRAVADSSANSSLVGASATQQQQQRVPVAVAAGDTTC